MTQWVEYPELRTPTLRARQAMAAEWLRACREVLEVGCGRNSIEPWLRALGEAVWILHLVDPVLCEVWEDPVPCLQQPPQPSYCRQYLREGPRHGVRIFQWACTLEGVLAQDFARPTPDGVCALGFTGFASIPEDALKRAVETARVFVLEYAVAFQESQRSAEQILQWPEWTATTEIRSVWGGEGVPANWRFRERVFYVLARSKPCNCPRARC